MTNPKPLPKSLHTVTVLVNVAQMIQRLNDQIDECAVGSALTVLGYDGSPDAYGLAAKAVKAMRQGND